MKPNVLMLSHMYPSPARKNPNSGNFIKTQLREYSKFANILLYVPVDVTPSFSQIKAEIGFYNKLKELREQLRRTLIEDLIDFKNPVKGRYIRFLT